MKTFAIGVRDCHTCKLEDFEKSYLPREQVTTKISELSEISTPFESRLQFDNRSFLNQLENTISYLPIFETGLEGSCIISNKMSGIFL